MKTNLGIFGISKERLLKGLEAIHLKHCMYSNPIGQNPTRCDCKFGIHHPALGLVEDYEQNGCPELRQVIDILSIMTEEEFLELNRRGKVEVSGPEFRGSNTLIVLDKESF